MRLLFIRHGDPDYEIDSLTEKGKQEARYLSDIVDRLNIDEIYQSPLGRARDTAAYCLDKLGKEAMTCDWLREFPAEYDPNLFAPANEAYRTELVKDPETGLYQKRILWDILPSYFGNHPELFDNKTWKNSELVKNSDMLPKYEYVISEFDKLLSQKGYNHAGSVFKVDTSSSKTLAFFCHFGITSVLLSHLWGISPFVPLQFLAMAPTSITEVVTEEREKGIAIFRALRIGDISHINAAGDTPSFAARFCERYENEDERH